MTSSGSNDLSYDEWKSDQVEINAEFLWLSAIALVTLICYWPSFSVPFYLDDFRIILENPKLQNVFDLQSIWSFSPARFLPSWTFALNYSMHGHSVFGYHLINFIVHLFSGFAAWWLATGLLRALDPTGFARDWRRYVPILAMAVFLLNPLQTQAVVYIVQRYASMAAMFYLLCMACWVWGRILGRKSHLLLSAVFLVAAFFCKQNAVTLPLAILLIELLFFRKLSSKQWLLVLTVSGVAGAMAIWLVTTPALDKVGLTRETMLISRIDYLATQMEVLWRYIGLFFTIGEQRFEYDIAIANGFSGSTTSLYTAGHLLLITMAILLWKRLPLFAFGILFYYLAHQVESGFLPIIDVAYEHRAYLPNYGLSLVVAALLALLIQKIQLFKLGFVAVCVLLLVSTSVSYARNQLWSDRIAFLQEETRLSPNDQRAWTSLGKELMREGRFPEALQSMQKADSVARLIDNGEYRVPTLLNIVYALHYNGYNQQALVRANSIPLDSLNRTELFAYYDVVGKIYHSLGQYRLAKQYLAKAVELHPNPVTIRLLRSMQ